MMNVRYLGTRMNKRQARGGVTGNRYSYSSGQPVFTIADADELQFHGEMEDGRPKFSYEYADGPSLVADGEWPTPITEVEVMDAEGIASLTIAGLETYLTNHPELTGEELGDIMVAEELGRNRVGARTVIQAAVYAIA